MSPAAKPEASTLLSVSEAHARVIALAGRLGSESVPLARAAGRVLAADIVADRAQPPFDASAMDGYAVRAADLAPGARLAVTGESAAGAGSGTAVAPGTAIRIFTGAPLPQGADTVLIQEDAERHGDSLTVRAACGPGANVRLAGIDFGPGDRIAAPRRLGWRDLALAAAMNAGDVTVTRRPEVALIATGDELVMPGDVPGPDQIIASNGFGLKAMLEGAGAAVRLLPIARDTAASLAMAFDLAEGADLVVTLGGASVGDRDLVASAAATRGLDLAFHKIAMRPGKPLLAGRLRGIPMVGLPGNPVSALICGLLFLRPMVEAMQGLPGGLPAPISARLGADLGENGPRSHFLRAGVTPDPAGGWRCTPFERQDSSLLGVLARSNALLQRPPRDPARRINDAIEFIWLD